MANAGRILILAKGAWEQLTNYVQLDLVTRNGIAYIARRASVGVDPALDVSYTNWMPFGSAAEIATTVSPGLVMPDGTSITVTSTGLIKAVLGINDLTDVDIENPLTNQVLRYNGTSWTAITLGTAADKSTTNAVTEDSTALVESGAVYDEIATVNSSITTLTDQAANKVLYFTGVACSATTGNFTSYSNSAITANHVVSECVFANPSAITTDVTWTTANGSVTLNGTCTTATTVNLVLVKKDN